MARVFENGSGMSGTDAQKLTSGMVFLCERMAYSSSTTASNEDGLGGLHDGEERVHDGDGKRRMEDVSA